MSKSLALVIALLLLAMPLGIIKEPLAKLLVL
jgi:hypothetical protein